VVVVGALVVVGLAFFLWRKRLAALRNAALQAAAKASPVPAHLLSPAPEGQPTPERVQIRE
jgi:hypothetical protein